ncbi:DUF5675 family protein [Flavobacteriaceae bacterium]|nr:DUF5675 family protein [Flavobacteriaceae bacterium]
MVQESAMIELNRMYQEDRTLGTMTMPDGTVLSTLERAWKDNEKNVSCIPEGVYVIERNTTGKYQYYGVLDVPERTHIEMHLGTKPKHSDGCILFPLKSDLITLMGWFGNDSWILRIKESNNVTL